MSEFFNGRRVLRGPVITDSIKACGGSFTLEDQYCGPYPFSVPGSPGLLTVAQDIVGAINEGAGAPAPPLAHASTHEPLGSDAMAIDAAAATGSLRTLGTTATSACAGNDARLSDDRDPTAHASTHEPLGGDAMAIDAAAATGSLRTLGTTATSACAGNDGRLSDARTPTAHAASHNAGGADAMAIDAAAATGSLRTLGSGATNACAGNDGRLSDARTPTAHKASHQSGGSDSIKLDDLASPDDNTDLNASTTAHGLLKKLSNVSTEFLNGQGNWSTPAGGGMPDEFFGDQSDGSLTVSGTTTQAKDEMRSTITINASQELKGNGFRIFCKTLTLNSGSIISCDGAAGAAYVTGGDASGGLGGGGGATGPSLGTGGLGGDGVNAAQGNWGESTTRCPGTGTTCDAGRGGDATDGGLSAGNAGLSSSHCDYRQPWRNLSQCVDLIYYQRSGSASNPYVADVIRGGAGGSGGGGYDGATDYSGGAGGGGGGILAIYAETINGPASGTAYLRANGGNGGAGRTNVGSGTGGGGGGGGGFVLLFYKTATNLGNISLQANAGSGGAGRAAGSAGVAGVTFSMVIS